MKSKIDKATIRRAQAVAALCYEATHSSEKAYSAGMGYLEDEWLCINNEGVGYDAINPFNCDA